ncbi:microcephalin isoform X1 [Petromyzon marinus]|uniref:Microcephalin isoform X2 n=1 Tax=Petromyzon marinus TaxID=7757 RepID=A0AAJ7TYM1_PETMA|nr:microcephalin isoform X2 [Petromyzon marinus]
MDKGLPQSNGVEEFEDDLATEDLLAEQSHQPNNQTVCFDLLKDVVAYVDVWSSNHEDNYTWAFSKQLLMMGATVSRKFTKNVTHVIFKDGLESTWSKAMSTGVKLVSVLWVDNCLKSQKCLDEALYPVRCDPRTTPNYCNKKRRWRRPLCVYDLEDEGSRDKRLQKKLEKLTQQLDNQKTATVGPDCLILAFDGEGQPVFSSRVTRSPVLDRVKSMADKLQEMKTRRENISLTASQMVSQSQSPDGSASPLQCSSNVPSCSLFNILLGEESEPGEEELSTPSPCHSFVADSDVSLDNSRMKSKQRSVSEKDSSFSHAVVQETPNVSPLGSSNATESNSSHRHPQKSRRKRLENIVTSDQNRGEVCQHQTSTGNCRNSSELSSFDLADVLPVPLCTDMEMQSSSTNIGSLTDTVSKTSSNSQDKNTCGGHNSSDDIPVTGEVRMETATSERYKATRLIRENIAAHEEDMVEGDLAPIVHSNSACGMGFHSEQSAATSAVFETSRKRTHVEYTRTPESARSRKKQKSQQVPESPSSGIILDCISPFDDYFLPENVQELAPRNQDVIKRVSALFGTPKTNTNSRRESQDGSKITGGRLVSLDGPTRTSSNPQQQRIDEEPQMKPQSKKTRGPDIVGKTTATHSITNNKGVKKFRLYSVKQEGYLAEVTYTTHVVRRESPRPPVEQEKKDTDTDSTVSDLCGYDASGNDRLAQNSESGKESPTINTNIPSFPDIVGSRQVSVQKEDPVVSRHQEKPSSGAERAQKGPRRSGRLKLMVTMKESEKPKNDGKQNLPRSLALRRQPPQKKSAVSGRRHTASATQRRQRQSLVLTSLHTEEQSRVHRVVRKLGGFELSEDVQESTTHVVLGSPRRTLNVLLGIVRGCWLLSLAWVLESAECGHWLEEEPYEMTDTFPAAQVRRQECRVGKASCLFVTTPPMFVSPRSVPPPAVLHQLITLSGGCATHTLRQAGIHVGNYPVCRRRVALQAVSEKWLLDCITYNEVRPMENYRPDDL